MFSTNHYWTQLDPLTFLDPFRGSFWFRSRDLVAGGIYLCNYVLVVVPDFQESSSLVQKKFKKQKVRCMVFCLGRRGWWVWDIDW